jgi:hypothetical protein
MNTGLSGNPPLKVGWHYRTIFLPPWATLPFFSGPKVETSQQRQIWPECCHKILGGKLLAFPDGPLPRPANFFSLTGIDKLICSYAYLKGMAAHRLVSRLTKNYRMA